ncbi:MAG: alpha/beta fold hydrolase [Bacilli bacterium]|nr:alpha/beta fold hydrolase [Bacilli bacterium]
MDKIYTLSSNLNNSLNGIIIYCHGLGSNKEMSQRFSDKLVKNNIGLIAFDFPGHGEDSTDFKDFNLDLCIDYLNRVITSIKNEYDVPIYLFGSSFGGFVILNRLINKSSDISKTILMCPAINFCEIMENKTEISLDYFNDNEYKYLYNNIKIYKDSYISFKEGDNNIKNNYFKNIFIIEGTDDQTTTYESMKEFSSKNDLDMLTIESGKHELYGYDDEIVNYIISIINKG